MALPNIAARPIVEFALLVRINGRADLQPSFGKRVPPKGAPWEEPMSEIGADEFPSVSTTALTTKQNWESYTPQMHDIWQLLYERQMKQMPEFACKEFLEGAGKIGLNANHIPNFDELSNKLRRLTGWSVVPVPGLIPEKEFFIHLRNREFPAARFLRTREQLDYIEEPDIFHDIFGHVPMLTNTVFADFMEKFGKLGCAVLDRPGALKIIARLYWYTVEFGLLQTEEGLKIYGAGIVSSNNETPYSIKSPSPNRIHFERERVMCTNYRIDDFQETYFVIRSFDELFESLAFDPAVMIPGLHARPVHKPGTVLRSDRAWNVGTHTYVADSHKAA
jgi:phenylalanine-4-hydroxylase